MPADDIARKATIFAALGLSPRGTLKAPSTVVLSNLERRMDEASRQVLSSEELAVCAARDIRPSVFLVAKGSKESPVPVSDDPSNESPSISWLLERNKRRGITAAPRISGKGASKNRAEIYRNLGLQAEEDDPQNCEDRVDDWDSDSDAYRVAARVLRLNAEPPLSVEDRWRAKVGLLPRGYFRRR